MSFGKDYIDNHLFDHLVNNSRSMLSVVNRNYCYEKVNNTFCRYLNIGQEKIVGKPLSEIWGEEIFRNKIKNNIDLCFQGNIVRYEANFEVPATGERYFEVIFRPLSDENGEFTHLLAETLDITDLRISQKAVNEMEAEFKRFESSLPVGLVRCDPFGVIVHYNKTFAGMLESEDEHEFEGLNIKEFYADKYIHDILLVKTDNEKIHTFRKVPLITTRGKIIVCRLNRYIVPDRNTSAPLFYDFSVEDITRETMLENRLLQAKKLETVGSLAGGIAHDFNNILLSVFGYAELLLDEVRDNPVALEMTGRIFKAVSRAKDIVNQILAFSRQVEQEKIPVNVASILDEAVSLIQSSKNEKIKVVKNYHDRQAEVYADPTQLFRVFMNLMMNGIQAMEKKGGTLEIGLDIVPGEALKFESGKSIVADKYVRVKMKDTGTGMSESVMSRIFDPYFTTKEVGKGSGLGLSVSYGIISELEGEITVRSEKNKGSVFSVFIPLLERFSTAQQGDDLPKKRIMFISDEQCCESKILSLALEKSGYIIDIRKDIDGLHDLADENVPKPDLMIFSNDEYSTIDSGLLSGFIKEKNIDIPVILLVNSDFDISKDALVNSGIVKNVLFKPVSLKEILSAIEISVNN